MSRRTDRATVWLRSRAPASGLLVLALSAWGAGAAAQNPGASPSADPGPTTIGAFWLPFDTLDDGYVATSGTNIEVDAQGGVHMTYAIELGQDDGRRPAYYLYCRRGCAERSHWSRTRLGDHVVDARLQLDAAGHPRVMLYAATSHDPADASAPRWYRYAACDARCADSASWTITPIASTTASEPARSGTNDYFAIDPQGHPAFIYSDTSDDHGGTFYESCLAPDPADCTAADQWQEITLASTFLLDAPELAFTPDGQPRFVGEYINTDQGIDRLVYGECDAACTLGGSTQLYGAGGSASYSLRLDRQGRPRIVFYTGNSGVGEALDPYQLYYLWCDADCTTLAGWSRTDLHTQAVNGWSVDLALDRRDRPRFVYKLGDAGPGYAWCDLDCQTSQPTWRSILLESRDVLQGENPVQAFVDCSESAWTSGHQPSLALDPEGNPWVGFDTRHQYGGVDLRSGHQGETCPISADIALARVLTAALP